MSSDDREAQMTEFEQRTRELLRESSERLPARVRSRLTQARYAALSARLQPPSMFRRWVPAGALAGVVLALFVVLAPHGTGTVARVAMAGAQFEDIEMLTDSEALPLNGDQDIDYDFYEWAANEADGTSGPTVGS
jgi:hypothetical protein